MKRLALALALLGFFFATAAPIRQVGQSTSQSASYTHLDMLAMPDGVLTGTTTVNGSTTVTGTSTLFLSEVHTGDRISVSSAASTYATVTAIASNTSLTVSAVLGNGTSQTINAKHAIWRALNTAGTPVAVQNDLGNVGIGTLTPGAKLQVVGSVKLGDGSTVNPVFSLWNASNVEAFRFNSNGSNWMNSGLGIGSTFFNSSPPTDGIIIEGNVGIATTIFGADAAKVLSFGGPATAPTTRPADVVTFYPFDVNGAGTMGLAWMSEDNGIGILGLRNGFGTLTPDQFAEFEQLETITGAVTDGYAAAIRLDPGYTAATALTVTRHNFVDYQNPSVAGAGPAALTDAAIGRFDAAAGTHKAVDAGTTKTSPGTVNAWVKWNLNGVIYYTPMYTSKTD